jgi:hypothetical protein
LGGHDWVTVGVRLGDGWGLGFRLVCDTRSHAVSELVEEVRRMSKT